MKLQYTDFNGNSEIDFKGSRILPQNYNIKELYLISVNRFFQHTLATPEPDKLCKNTAQLQKYDLKIL